MVVDRQELVARVREQQAFLVVIPVRPQLHPLLEDRAGWAIRVQAELQNMAAGAGEDVL